MADAMIQPQGFASLNPRSRIAMAANAIMVGKMWTNLVTGNAVTGQYYQQAYGADPATVMHPGGIAWGFAQASWLIAEMPAEIGTQSFVEFWHGYPSSWIGVNGSGPWGGEPQFVLGSSTNNAAIVTNLGTNHGDNTVSPDSWGTLYVWGGAEGWEFIGADDVLTPGVLTTLLAVHKQDRVELWRDGILRRVVMIHSTWRQQADVVAGAFLANNYWASTSDMLMCGRAIIDNVTADEAREFTLNPWVLFDDGVEEEETLEAAVTKQLRAALYMNGQGYILPRPAGNTSKPLVLMSTGEVRQRSAAEGLPIILDGSGLRTLKSTEDLIV